MKLLTLSEMAMTAAGTADASGTSFGELLNEGMITFFLGMGTVFAVLIVLMIIIALVGKILGRKVVKVPKEEVSAPAPVAPAVPVEVNPGYVSGDELVAVMAAAIAAFGGENPQRIRIRSIRRSTNWNK